MGTGVAVIGTGFMGPVHVEGLRRAGVPVVGILGSSPERSQQAATALGLDKAYTSLEELLADSAVASVHVGTPNRLHFQQVCAVLESGRHVLCEKPLAMTSSETARLVQLAADRPRQAAGVNYNIRFYPLCLEARERIARGDVGSVFHVTGSYTQDWLLYPTDYNWRVLAEEGGALRAVADIGTHWLDLMQSLTGLEVEAVCADLQTVHAARQRPIGEVQTFQATDGAETEAIPISTDDAGSILLRFAGGARGNLAVSQVVAGRKNSLRFEVAGSQESLSWDSERCNELHIGYRDRPNQVLPRDPALLTQAAGQHCSYPGGHNEGYADSFKQCFRSFYDYIHNR